MASPSKKLWTNPKDVMKIHRIKRHGSVGITRSNSASDLGVIRRNSLSDISGNNVNALLNSKSDCSLVVSNSLKRKNPFTRDSNLSSKKRSFLDTSNTSLPTSPLALVQLSDSDVETSSNKLIQDLHQADRLLLGNDLQETHAEENVTTAPSAQPMYNSAKTVLCVSPQISNSHESVIIERNLEQGKLEVHPHPPLDWSLKSKLRIVAYSSIAKFSKVPGIDARNVDSFVHYNFEKATDWEDLDFYQKLKRCCMHYSYPQMPWITVFPRMSTDYKSRTSGLLSTSEEALAAVHKDWMIAFTSVYQQLRSGLCPYFYTCTHQFNVVFRCLRTVSGASLSALLSPSTRGLREMLRKEGVDFRMPNLKSQKADSVKSVADDSGSVNTTQDLSQSQTFLDRDPFDDSQQNIVQNSSCLEPDVQNKENISTGDKNEESDEDIDDDEGASRWLEGMGFDKKNFPTLEPLKVKLQREGFREIDNRPQSMLYVEGADVHTFFNFLLNYASCTAQSGPQHGIPPTILSPVMFVGGTLVQNMVKHTVVTNDKMVGVSKSNGAVSHVLEVSGPLLPHHTLNIATILHDSQDVASAVVSCSTHMPSAALNTTTRNLEEKDKLTVGLSKLFVDISKGNPGFMEAVKDRLVCPSDLENGQAIRELNVSSEGYSWTC